MENILGLIRLRIKKGTNLIPRDSRTSDPYVVVTMAEQVCYNNKPCCFFFLVFLTSH
jgi:Ca2+-dependent lipid-binding protein